MAGLLGDDINDPRTLAVLQFAGALGGQRDRGFGGLLSGLNAGGQEYIGALARAKKQAQEEEFRKAQMEEVRAQARERNANASQRVEEARKLMAQQQRERQFQQALGAFGGPTSPAQALAAGGGPTNANGQRIGTPQSMDWQGLARQFPDYAKQIIEQAGMRNLGRDKVTYQETTDATGAPVKRPVNEYGDVAAGGDLRVWKDQQVVDLGGQKFTRDPVTNKLTLLGNMTRTPDNIASTGLGYARLEQDKKDHAGVGKPPPGYRFKTDGSLEAIPGGPADIKAGEAGAKAAKAKDNASEQAKSVLSTVKDAIALVGPMTTGVGGLAAILPATSARDLQAKLTTIKANLGFDRLQEMRAASPTGGALGQVAVQELQALQATVASLDQLQSSDEVDAALRKIERHYKRWQGTMAGSAYKPEARTIVRTGTRNGKRVVMYSDGSIVEDDGKSGEY